MTKNRATRVVAAVILVGGLAAAPLLDNSEPLTPGTHDTTTIELPSPRFRIAWRSSELTLSGHTRSEQHEQSLLQVADSSYTDNTASINFQPLGIVPSYWEESTLQVLSLLAETESAEALLTADEISIRAVTIDGLAWQGQLDRLKKIIPSHVSIDVDTLLVKLTPGVSMLCGRAFAELQVGAIEFEESSADFRSSAYPRLDRVIGLATACIDSQVQITGHTDSSGDELWNQRLSVKRANAVGDYVVAGGIDRSRLRVAGVGSSAPIADDSTRYGRSLNRRIEITLSNTD